MDFNLQKPNWLEMIRPSGGLYYHYQALKYKKSLWTEFLINMDEWLNQWVDVHDHLIIFGSSGGYTLSKQFISRFKKIICVDPDPLAYKIFSMRLSGCGAEISWDFHDYFLPKNHQGSLHELEKFLDLHPNHSVLFSNVLGQVCVESPLSKNELDTWMQNLTKLLLPRSFATYHDRISTNVYPDKANSIQSTIRTSPLLSVDEILELYFRPHEITQLKVVDHGTTQLFHDETREMMWWRLSEKKFHLVEAIHS